MAELEPFGLEGAEALEPGKLWKIPEGFAAVTGVGIPMTLLRLAALIPSRSPAWLVNMGITGAYPDAGLELGNIAVGISEIFADLGMEMPGEEGFRPLSAFPFADPQYREPLPLWMPEWIREQDGPPRLRLARGATVNACAGLEETGKLRRLRFQAGFESMEGAACALIGKEHGIPVLEIRAISNIAGNRNMRPANVNTALHSLRAFWEKHRRWLP